jgi:7-keto-8-aminopelargonate synthetase-like enzyme/predicted N-acyltransferase
MPKSSKITSFYDTVNEFITLARKRKIVHLYTDDEAINGRTIKLQGYTNELINFGSCSYLGLEKNQKIISSGTKYLEKYGSQFSCSRAYVSIHPYKELEERLQQMFKRPLLLSPSSTIGHFGTVPCIVEEGDAIILDHQAHISMYQATKLIDKKVNISLLRHSRLDELQKKIDELSPKHNRIWYFFDSIYSMYGDVAPIDELMVMLNKNPQLHFYIDDAHGMSWTGTNGTGYLLSKIGELHPKMILATSLAKGFGSSGGVFVFPTDEWCWKVRTWGGPLTYSGPQQPATLGCSIASANMHLSDEIHEKQNQLLEKIKLCNSTLTQLNLPLIANTEVPIRFIGVGLPTVGYNLVNKLMHDGYYTNLGIYPAVPETCTGIRFTINNNHTNDDILGLCNSLAKNLPLALQEEGRTTDDIFRAFKTLRHKQISNQTTINTSYKIEKHTSIKNISQPVWDELMADKGMFDYEALLLLENTFTQNAEPENNWTFMYYFVRNTNNKIIAATFFTNVLLKDDMLSPADISNQIEEKREADAYYLTSRCYMMGTPLTEGQHLYINRNAVDWKNALMFLLDEIWADHETQATDALYLRDFAADDLELRNYFIDRGFIKVDMPNTNIIEEMNWQTPEEFLQQLPPKKRNRLKREVIRFQPGFQSSMVNNPTDAEVEHWYTLYKNIQHKNRRINTFALPKKLFYQLSKHPNIDIIQLKIIPELDTRPQPLPVAIGFVYKTKNNYCPWVLGLDYNFKQYNTYRQLLFTAVLRAKQLGKQKIYLGLTADEEKEKLGAKSIPSVAYIQVKDKYNLSVIGLVPR